MRLPAKIGKTIVRTICCRVVKKKGDDETVEKCKLKATPSAIDPVIRCATCNSLIVRTSTRFWGCPKALDHGRLKTEQVLKSQIAELVDAPFESINRLVRMLKSRFKLMQRLGATEDDIDTATELKWKTDKEAKMSRTGRG